MEEGRWTNHHNLVYVDGETGTTYAKRFNVNRHYRDKEYDLTKDGSTGIKGAVFYHAAQWRVGGTQHHPYTCIYSKDQSIWLRLIRNCHQGQELWGNIVTVSGAQGNTGECGSVEPWRHEGVYRRRKWQAQHRWSRPTAGRLDTGETSLPQVQRWFLRIVRTWPYA